MKNTIAFLILFFDVVVSHAQHKPGTLDSSFGINGTVRDSIVNGYGMGASDCAVQADGKILTVGAVLTRRLSNGARDLSFASGGYINMVDLIGDLTYCRRVFARPNGRIVVVGYNYPNHTYLGYALQFLADGTVDSSFGANGFCWLPSLHVADAKLLNDGSILVGANDAYVTVGKVTPAGTLDSSFGTAGLAAVYSGFYDGSSAYLDTTADGRIVVAGIGYGYSHSSNAMLVRFKRSGMLDSTFATNGKTYPFPAWYCWGMAVQADGKIMTSFAGGLNGNSLFRFRANGTLDSTYAQNGEYELPAGLAYFKLVDSGKIVCAGSDGGFVVGKLKAGGTQLDSSFGTNGVTHTHFLPNSGDRVWALAIQPDGKIICVGASATTSVDDPLGIARYHDVSLPTPPSTTNDGIPPIPTPTVTLYPNPAGPELHLSGISTTLYNAPFHILNSTGAVLQSGTLPQHAVYSIPVASLPAGLYYLRLPHTATPFLKQ